MPYHTPLRVLFAVCLLGLSPVRRASGQTPDDIKNQPYLVDGVPHRPDQIPLSIREESDRNKTIAIVPEGAIWTYDVFLVDGKIIKSPPYFFTIDDSSRNGKGAGSGNITHGGGYSLKSSDGSVSISGGVGNSVALGVARGLYASQRSLPGIFSSSPREGWISSNTKASLDRYEKEVEFQAKTTKALENAQKSYSNEVVASATEKLSGLHRNAEAQLRAKFGQPNSQPLPSVPVAPVLPGPRTTQAALPGLRQRIEELANDPTAPAHAKWPKLESLLRLRQDRGEVLSPVDSAAIDEVLKPYFDDNGLVNSEVLGSSYDPAIETLGKVLKTPIHSKSGQLVRIKINKVLSQLSLPESVESVFAALANLIAADEALSIAYNTLGASFIDTADAIMGFTPAAALVDASQLFCGLATGYDLAGNRLERSDYLLRGVGVVLGVFGLRNAVTIGKEIIPKSFVVGSEVVRRFGIGRRVQEFTSRAKESLFNFVETVGKKFQTEKTFTRSQWIEYLETASNRLAHANGVKFTPDTIESVVKSSQRASGPGSLDSRALQSLKKKVDRRQVDSAFKGSPTTPADSEALVKEILSAPHEVQYANRRGYLDVYDAKGRGVRFVSETHEFRTFLEKSLVGQGSPKSR